MVISTQCSRCRHWEAGNLCLAFRDGIPDAIWENRHDHRDPYEGDGGIRFEPIAEPGGGRPIDRGANGDGPADAHHQ